MLLDELMTKVISLVEALRLKGVPVNAEVINSVAQGLIIVNDRSLLIENGGLISLSHQWGVTSCIGWSRKVRKCADGMLLQKKYLSPLVY